MTTLIIYCTVAILHESITFYLNYKKVKVKLKNNEMIRVIKNIATDTNSGKFMKRKVVFYAIIFTPILLLMFLIMFPFSVLSLIKKAIFGKSKLEKEAEAESQMMEESKRRSEEWLKNEGEPFIIE